MPSAARCYLTAAAVIATGATIAVTSSGAPLLPGIQVRPYQLMSDGTDTLPVADEPLITTTTDVLQQIIALNSLLMQQAAANAELLKEQGDSLSIYTAEITSIERILASQVDLGNQTLGDVAPLNSAFSSINEFVDANNLLIADSEKQFDSLIGAENFSPAAIDSSLLIPGVGTADVPFVTDGIGGVEGATGNTLAAYGDYITYLNTQFGLSLADFTSQDLTNLASDDLAFNQALVADELAFNHNMLTEELAAESAAFGGNGSALNGVVDRVINIDNLYLATGESSVNDALGANYSPAELTASVLTGDNGYTGTDPTTAFDTGELGGLQGIFDQNSALASDLAGLTPAEISSAFASGASDPTAFTAAIGDLYDLNVFTNLAPDFATMSGDFDTILLSLF
jgi:hypothetical protein